MPLHASNSCTGSVLAFDIYNVLRIKMENASCLVPLRIEYSKACYHVINRGDNRRVVFAGPEVGLDLTPNVSVFGRVILLASHFSEKIQEFLGCQYFHTRSTAFWKMFEIAGNETLGSRRECNLQE